MPAPTIVLPMIGAAIMLLAGFLTWGTPIFWVWLLESGALAVLGCLTLAKWRVGR